MNLSSLSSSSGSSNRCHCEGEKRRSNSLRLLPPDQVLGRNDIGWMSTCLLMPVTEDLLLNDNDFLLGFVEAFTHTGFGDQVVVRNNGPR